MLLPPILPSMMASDGHNAGPGSITTEINVANSGPDTGTHFIYFLGPFAYPAGPGTGDALSSSMHSVRQPLSLVEGKLSKRGKGKNSIPSSLQPWMGPCAKF